MKNIGKRVLRDSFPKICPGDQDLRASRPQKYEDRGQVCFVFCHILSLDEHLPVRGVSVLCVAKSMGGENEDNRDLFNDICLSRNEMMAREAVESDEVFVFFWGGGLKASYTCF